MICPNCKNLKTEFFFEAQNIHGSRKISEEKFVIFRCNKCGVIFPRLTADDGFFKRYYPQNYYSSGSFHPNFIFREYELLCLYQVKSLVGCFTKKGRVLDFGCGQGQFLAFLPNVFEKYGIEINPRAVRFIEKNLSQIKIFNDISFLKPKSLKFNLITLWNVLEHLENPKTTLCQLATLMEKDGVIFISTPNSQSLGFKIGQANWFHLDAPRHLAIFNMKNLSVLCEEAGLKIISTRSNWLEYPLDLFWSIYNRYKTKQLFLNFLLGLFSLPASLMVKLFCLSKPAKCEIITIGCKRK